MHCARIVLSVLHVNQTSLYVIRLFARCGDYLNNHQPHCQNTTTTAVLYGTIRYLPSISAQVIKYTFELMKAITREQCLITSDILMLQIYQELKACLQQF